MKRFFLSVFCAAAALSFLASPSQAQTASGAGTGTGTTGTATGTTGAAAGNRLRGGGGPERHAREIIAKYDKDGDHALNATELAAFFEVMRERVAGRGATQTGAGSPAPSGASSPSAATNLPGHGDPQAHAAKAIEKFDKNGDGKLDAGELTAMLMAFRQRAKQGQTSGQGPSPIPSQTHSAPATTIPSPAGN